MNRIEEQFVSYQMKVIHPDANETQLKETQRSFYGGAVAMASVLSEISRIASPKDRAMAFKEVGEELDHFKEDVLKGKK